MGEDERVEWEARGRREGDRSDQTRVFDWISYFSFHWIITFNVS